MLRKSLEDYINSQRLQLAKERLKLSVKSCEQKEFKIIDGDRRDEHPVLGIGEYDHKMQMLNDQRMAEYEQYEEQVHFESSVKEQKQLKDIKEQDDVTKDKQAKKVNVPQSGYDNYLDRLGEIGYIPTNTVDDVRFEKVRKQEIYAAELNKQIAEKKMLEKKHKKDDLIEDALERGRVVNAQHNSHSHENTVEEELTEKIHKQEKYMGQLKQQMRENKMLDKEHKKEDLIEEVVKQQYNLNMYENTVEEEHNEKIRKQEKYMGELDKQVKDKKMIDKRHKEEDRIEDEMECGRVETQQFNLNFNKQEGFGFGRHCYSPDFTGSASNEQPQ